MQTPHYHSCTVTLFGAAVGTTASRAQGLSNSGNNLKRLVVSLALCCCCFCFYCRGIHDGLMNRGPVYRWTAVPSLQISTGALPAQNSPHAEEFCSRSASRRLSVFLSHVHAAFQPACSNNSSVCMLFVCV